MADMDLQIKISSQVTQAVSSVQKLASSFDQLLKSIAGAATALQVFDVAGKAITEFGRKLGQVSGAMKKFGRDFTQNVTAPILLLAGLSLRKVFEEAVAGMGNSDTNAFAASIQGLKRAFDELLLTLGDRLAPIAARVANILTGLINAFLSLSPATQEFIVQFALIVAAIGPVVLSISAFLGIVGKLTVVFGQLVTYIPTIVAVFTAPLTAIVVMATALASVTNLFLDLRKAGVSTGEAIYKSLSIVATALNEQVYGGLSKVLAKMDELQSAGIKGTPLGEMFYGKGNKGILADASKSLDELSKLNAKKFDELKVEIDEKLKPLGTSLADSLTFGLSSAAAKFKSAFSGIGAAATEGLETQEVEDPVAALLEERANQKRKQRDQELIASATQTANVISNGVASAFTSLADGSKTAEQAFNDMARSIISNLTQMIIQAQIFNALMGAFGGATQSAGAGGASIGSTPVPLAEGGPVFGPGTSTSDSIPARLSNGEYVLKAQAVRNLGVGFLNGLNNIGRNGVKPKNKGGLRSFADGGYVGTGGSGPQVIVQNTGTPKENQGSTFDPSSGVTTVILQDVQRNGPISKAMQSTFGMKRGAYK